MAHAGTTLLHKQLQCKLGAVSGDKMREDEEHWFIENLVWGPYQDTLGQEFFLASVSGLDNFSVEVHRIPLGAIA